MVALRPGRTKLGIHSMTAAPSRSRLAGRSLLVLSAALLLYALPTALEFAALRHWSPWISSVLPGDLAGCAFLGIAFRKVKAGVLLYCLLTVFEACTYGWNIMPLSVLPWFTDLVPTVVVSAMMLRSAGTGAKLVAIH